MTRKTTQTFPPLRYGPLFFPDTAVDGAQTTQGAETGGGDDGQAASQQQSNQFAIDRAEYDTLKTNAGKVAELEAKLAAHETSKMHMARLLKPGTQPDKVQESMRFLMAEHGYTPEEISTYLQNQQAGDGAADEGNQNQQSSRGKAQGNEELEALKGQIADLSGKLGSHQKELASNNERRLRELLVNSTSQALDSNADLATLKRVVESTTGEGSEEAWSKAKEFYLGLIRQQTLQNVAARRATERNRAGRDVWDDRWIAEAAAEATTSVLQGLRTGIGDPSKIGRSTETVLADLGLPDKPLPAPEAKQFAGVGDAMSALEKWNQDQLVRASIPSGPTRI